MEEKLLFFLFGILFYEIIFPILSEVANTIVGFLQLLQGKQATKMVKYNKAVEEYKKSQEEVNIQAIGFQMPSYTDEEEDEDDDE